MAVVMYVATIYLTARFVPRVWLALGADTGISLSSLALILVSGAAVVVAVVMRRTMRFDARGVAALAAIGAIYWYLYAHEFVEPIEKLHLIEYGLLPWLVWRALDFEATAGTIAAVWLLSAAAGGVDELIQHVTPGRFGEVRDVLVNWASSALGMALMALAARLKSRPT